MFARVTNISKPARTIKSGKGFKCALHHGEQEVFYGNTSEELVARAALADPVFECNGEEAPKIIRRTTGFRFVAETAKSMWCAATMSITYRGAAYAAIDLLHRGMAACSSPYGGPLMPGVNASMPMSFDQFKDLCDNTLDLDAITGALDNQDISQGIYYDMLSNPGLFDPSMLT